MVKRPLHQLNESLSYPKKCDIAVNVYKRREQYRAALGIQKQDRVLPSSTVLSSTVDGTRTPCPLIQDLLRSVGKGTTDDEQKQLGEPVIDEDRPIHASDGTPALFDAESIDDSSHSCLSVGQHRRFLQLKEAKGISHAVPLMKGEYKKLRALVESEQSRYLKALKCFWQHQKERLSVGFRGGKPLLFAELATRRNLTLDTWVGLKLPSRFGNYCQMISCAMVPGADSSTSKRNVFDSVQRQPVCYAMAGTDPIKPAPPLKVGSELPFPGNDNSNIHLLSDPEALRLAKEHRVDIVVSDSTLEVLMRSDDVGSWMIPTVRVSDPPSFLIIGEPTITTFSSPRECLTRGFRDALYHDLQKGLDPTGPKALGSTQTNQLYDYVVMTLPAVRQKKHRVLVRRDRRLVRDESGLFLRFHVHVEYFPERGLEEPNDSDRALWMLDFLLEPSSRVVVVKVHPSACTVAGSEDVSLAHTLTQNQFFGRIHPGSEVSCSDRWHNLLHILTALPMIGPKKHVLCYPGQLQGEQRSFPSISVHLLDDEGQFGISEILKRGEVPLNATAFGKCYRPWRWKHDRIPNTFPTKNVC